MLELQQHRHRFIRPDVKQQTASSRRVSPELCILVALPNEEGAGKTGWPLHPGLPRKTIAQRARKPRVQAVTTGLPCAMVYGLYVISPVNLADCHRHRRDAKHHRQLSAEPLGRQDHTISPSAPVPLVNRHVRVHRIPLRVRDDA